MADTTPDAVFFNGNIITFDNDFTSVNYIGIKDGKIVALGNGDDYKSTISDNTTLHDLDGKTVLPGFIESHNHFNAVANQWGWIDVGITQCTTIADVLTKIKSAVESQSSELVKDGLKPWIKCVGFDDTLIAENRDIVKEEIDSVSGDFPVWIWHPSLHRAYVNSKAFEISGITEDVKNPDGGTFVRNSDGKLTGQMEEMAAYQMVYVHLNKTLDMSTKRADMWNTAKFFASKGVTSVHDLFVGPMLFNLYRNAFAVNIKLIFMIIFYIYIYISIIF